MNTKFLFIPSWITESIRASRGDVDRILDYGYIKNILSGSDLAEMVYFSENASRMLQVEAESAPYPLPPASSQVVSVITLWNTLGKGARPNSSDVDQIRTYIAINDCERSLNERLFTPQPVVKESPYEVFTFDHEVIGVVIHPGAFVPGQSDENRFVLIRALALELTRLNSPEVAAGTLLMRRYIELLGLR